MASISRRAGIRWLPEETSFSETTSTIVLTSKISRTFVDLRLQAPFESTSKLTWGIAGISSRSNDSQDVSITKGIWTHAVDTRGQQYELGGEHPADEGLMKALPQERNEEIVYEPGYSPPANMEKTLEWGSMLDPDTNRVRDYEELWVDEDVPASSSSTGENQTFVMLLSDTNTDKITGTVVCVGGYCQGIMRTTSNGILAERWVRSAVNDQLKGDGTVSDEWHCVWKGGDAVGEDGSVKSDDDGGLCCMEAVSLRESKQLRVGREVDIHGGKWVCVEYADKAAGV